MTSKGKRPPKRKEPEQIQQIQQIPQIQQIQQKQSYFNQNFLDEDFLNEGENEDDELYGLKNEINTIKENAFKIDENLKSKYQVISKKEQIERLIIEWDCVKENQINLNLIEKDKDYIQAIKFNFTGLEKSTDLIFYALIKYFKKHPKKGLIKFNEILVSCCKYISIWSLHYLSLADDKTILMLNSVPFNIRKRVAGCDRISDNMAVSLQFSNELHLKDENSLCNSSKVVIINEDTQNTFLIDYLINKNSEANNPTSFFKYSILKESNKVLNLFECCESLSNIFLTERNLTVITFNSSQSVDDVEKSVVRRLLKVMSKNILPIKVVILAIGSIDENKLGNYKNKIISYLSKLQIDIKSDVDKKLKLNGQDLSFQEQKKLSNDINLSEQIKLFLDMINFSSIDLENNNNPSFNRKVKNDKNIDELNQKLALCLKEISSIKKNEIAEVKSMKMPPSACVQVMEAICIIFSKKPSIENFNKLVSDTQKPLLTDLIPNYDMNSISDYVKNNLKKYYENPDYNPNKVKMSSNYMSILCKWSRLVYEYGSSNPNWQESTNSSALKSFLFSNSFYMFPWPAYVDDLDSTVFEYVNGIDKNITYIDDLIKKLYLKESKVLTIDEYFDKFNQNKEIDSYMALNGFYSLPEKHAKSESAKGNFYFNEETKLIITDIEIISDIILFLTTKSKSNFYERVHKIVGENVPIVKLNDLNNFLTTKLSSSSIDRLITYLVDISLIKIIEYDSSKETNLIIPLFLLNENSINEIDSIDSKNELEYEMKLELFSSLPNDSFFKFIIHFFDINKTQSVWKYGLFNVDSGCDVILTCSQSVIKLSAKIFNSDSYGCEGLSDKYLKFIFYDYYFYLAYILDYNNVSYKIQKNEKTSLFIKDYYRESYLNYIAQKHNFNSINRCENCSCTNKEIKKLIKYDNYLNPSFEYIDKSNLISIYDGFTQSFNFEDQNKFEIKFPTDSNDYFYDPFIEITKKLSDKTVTIKYTIKLNERSLETYSYQKYENKIIEEKRDTGLVNHDSYGNQVTWMKLVQAHNQYKQINIKSNDSFRIQIENGKEIEVVAYLNMEKLLAIRLSNEMPILNLNAGFIFHSKYKNIKTKDDRRTFQPNVAHVLISNQNMYKKIDSCNNSSNLRNEYRRLKIYFENNLSKIVKSLKIYESGRDEGLRGVLLLPKKINELSTPNIPAKIPYSFDDFDYHMFCISYEEFRAAEKAQFVLHSHLIDVAGLPFNKSLIDKKFLVYLITSAYALSQAQNKYIFPKYEILLPKIAKEKMNTEQLDKTMRFYSYNLFQRLLICINLSDISGDLISLDIANFTKQIKKHTIKIGDYTKDLVITDYQFVETCCFYCSEMKYISYSYVNVKDKLQNAYSNCAIVFGYFTALSNVKKNQEIPVKINKEFFEKFSSVKHLGVINNRVEIIETEKNEYQDLFEINFENNNLEFIPNIVEESKKLIKLSIKRNHIKKIPINLFQKIPNLKVLVLDSLPLNEVSQFENMKPKQLINLPDSLSELELISLPFSYIPFNLENIKLRLKSLKFIGVKWYDNEYFSDSNSMVTIDDLKEKFDTVITSKHLDLIFQHFDLTKKNYLNQREIIQFNAFIFKKIPRLGEIPNYFFNFINLETLDLSYQAIKLIPDEISFLKNLKTLNLNNCILLESISSKLAELPMKSIQLENTFSLKTPPPEICKRGLNSIMGYLKRLSTGSVLCKRTKLMLVGLGEAGKTSLLNALINETTSDRPPLTDGIEINEWNIKLSDNSNLVYSMWDFAGQSIYYNSHQFFLSSRAIYLLVWNVRLGVEYAGLDFWLNSIKSHAPTAPIFVVGTHIDEVSKFHINKEKLKSKYKQIAGFHFISSVTKKGIDELSKDLIEKTLQQTYMGEKIPEVWLNFETKIKNQKEKNSLLNYQEIVSLAEECGINQSNEILDSIRFLNDLGSVQYFEINGLKDKVVINPQWIVDVVSCVVSVKNTPIIDGRLFYKDLAKIFHKYDSNLYNWILKLTEEFDLTFPVIANNSKEPTMNIVPCLLPDNEPDLNLNIEPSSQINNFVKIKEFKVVYTYEYLPAGLFNRIQVRLFQYGDNSNIWKNGSLLIKNNHKALIKQTDKSTIEIKVIGVKPENIVFLIHEVIENLINESFNGIKYDYSFPCPECVDSQSEEPCLFSSSLLHRATKFKAPFLQCNQYFHAISIQEMLAVMPLSTIDGPSNLDLNLEYSLRDLKQMKKNLKYDIAFWYCHLDQIDSDNCINPIKIIEEIKKENYKLWYSKNSKEEKIDKITYAIKDSKLVVLGISDQFANDEKSMQVFELVKNIIKKEYLIVEFGTNGSHDWMKNPNFASICSDVRIIMQDPKRYKFKLIDMVEALDRKLKDVKKVKKQEQEQTDVFISYCWTNSHEAVKKGTKKTNTSLGWLDPRYLATFLKENGINAWIDIEEMSSGGLFGEITKGMTHASLFLACFSDEYVKSKNCSLEFRFAHVSLKLPIIKLIVGTGNEWKKHEMSLIGGDYPEINFQYENPDAYNNLLNLVKEHLNKINAAKSLKIDEKKDKLEKQKLADNNSIAIQELYELTQRKFLKKLYQISDKIPKYFPRLLCLDQVESNENFTLCIRPMCEFEEGWHILPDSFILFNESILPKYYSYLVRIMNIIKSGNLSNQLKIFLTQQGVDLLEDIEKKLVQMNDSEETVFSESYLSFLKQFNSLLESEKKIDDENNQVMSLKRCEMKNGKILWMCKQHIEISNAKVLEFSIKYEKNSNLNDLLANQMLQDIENVETINL